jgi:hypothetical protein
MILPFIPIAGFFKSVSQSDEVLEPDQYYDCRSHTSSVLFDHEIESKTPPMYSTKVCDAVIAAG